MQAPMCEVQDHEEHKKQICIDEECDQKAE